MPKLFEKGQQPTTASRAEARAQLHFFLQRARSLLPAIEQVATYLDLAQAASDIGDMDQVHANAHNASKQLFLVSHCIVDVSILAGILKIPTQEEQ